MFDEKLVILECSRARKRALLRSNPSAAIVEYVADCPNVRNVVHTLKVLARLFLDNRQFDKGSKELVRLTSNFPSVLEEVKRTQSQGFRR